MASNYPPGVTGNEYAISGAHSERESDKPCPECSELVMETTWGNSHWLQCTSCSWWEDIDPPDPGDDPDRKYDEERDRQILTEHEDLGWNECMDEDCDFHNDEHVETKGLTNSAA